MAATITAKIPQIPIINDNVASTVIPFGLFGDGCIEKLDLPLFSEYLSRKFDTKILRIQS